MRKEYKFNTIEKKKKDLRMDKVNTNFFNIKSVLEEYGVTSGRKNKQKNSSSLIPILEQTKQTESKILGKTQKDFQKSPISDPYA